MPDNDVVPLQSPPAPPAQPAEGQPSPEEQKPPKTYSQEEMNRIVRRVRSNTRDIAFKEAEAKFWREQAERGRSSAAARANDDGPPNREAFETYEEYVRATARHEGRLAAREERETGAARDLEKTQQEEHDKRRLKFQAAVAKIAEEKEDAEELISDLAVSPAMFEAIAESEIGAQVALHLASHPEEAARIVGLPPARQAAAIGRIEASLEAVAAKPKETGKPEGGTEKEPSKAPEPITPVGGRSAGASELPSDRDDVDTWMRKERARMRAKNQ